MAVLVLNCGSSSVKYALYGDGEEDILLRGKEERVADHGTAIEGVLDLVAEALPSGIGSLQAVGHRVVHGGRRFRAPHIVDKDVLEAIRAYADLAPLHNPANIRGIQAAASRLAGVPQVAVFDTSFHATIPPWACNYAIPMELAKRHRIRRYGFHGISHQYVHDRAVRLLGRQDATGLSIITCHLGNGASAAAIRGGRCVDTSMGFSPLEGLVMGSRCGDLDPSIVHYLLSARGGMTDEQVHSLLNKESGLRGLSGLSGDVRDLVAARSRGHEGAAVALSVFCYRLKKYIAAYTGVLGGVDALAFTAGIGENSPEVRAEALEGVAFLGIAVDPDANRRAVGVEAEITGQGSRARVFVIPTDEDRMIYREVVKLLNQT